MTEDEAKTRWCPFARLLAHTYTLEGDRRSESGYAYNRSPDPSDEEGGPYIPDGTLCLGAACMAWRWATATAPSRIEHAETGTHEPRVKIKPPSGDGWYGESAGRDRADVKDGAPYRWVIWARDIPEIPGAGYCGLAGAPQ